MTQPRAWVTGAGGLLGSAFVRTAAALAPHWEVRGLERGALDLTDGPAVQQWFARERPAAVIHCAAMSKSPACAQHPERARLVNVEATARLAGLAAEIPFVFFSTDLVFDGRVGNYAETDGVNPLTVYAETKVQAENGVRENSRHLIIRTSLNGGVSPTGDRGFNEELRRAWAAGRTTTLFTDEFRSPIAAVVTVRAVWALLAAGATGVFHVAGSERLSRWQIGQLLAVRCTEWQPRLEAGTLRDYSRPPRAPDTSLNGAKAQRLLPFPLPGFTEWLRENPGEPF